MKGKGAIGWRQRLKYNGIIQRKLALLDDQVQKLMDHTKDIDLAGFKESWAVRSMSERALQVSIEIMIDIAERIIALEEAGPVATATEAMAKLQALGVIQSSETYSSMVRFRNLIVHRYEVIDPELLFQIVKERLNDFRHFRDEIDRTG